MGNQPLGRSWANPQSTTLLLDAELTRAQGENLASTTVVLQECATVVWLTTLETAVCWEYL